MRLQKFLADAGVASRRKAELGVKVDDQKDKIEYGGKIIKLKSEKVYYAIDKPVGYISSVSDGQGKSILKLVHTSARIYPVGRLDKDSSGLMILTNDGDFANQVMHPRYGCEKEYFALLDRDLSKADLSRLKRGIRIDGKIIKPRQVELVGGKRVLITIGEGINREIRRLFGQLNYQIIKLKRIRIGKLELSSLAGKSKQKIKPEDIINKL